MQSRPTTLFIVVLSALACAGAQASTDRKIVHGTICQPENPSDAAKLRYMGRGLHAQGGDVDLVCPIVRDSTRSGLSFLEVRFQRGVGTEVANVPGGKFRIEFLSCSDTSLGNACDSSGLKDSDASNNPTSASISSFTGMAMDQDRAFAVKTRLPKGTVLKSITYIEKVN